MANNKRSWPIEEEVVILNKMINSRISPPARSKKTHSATSTLSLDINPMINHNLTNEEKDLNSDSININLTFEDLLFRNGLYMIKDVLFVDKRFEFIIILCNNLQTYEIKTSENGIFVEVRKGTKNKHLQELLTPKQFSIISKETKIEYSIRLQLPFKIIPNINLKESSVYRSVVLEKEGFAKKTITL